MSVKFRIAGVVGESIVDGPGLRYTVFFQGCPHGCAGCHNPETHDVAGGREGSLEEIKKGIEKNPLLDGVTLSGGEPFAQSAAAAAIAEFAKTKGLNVITYTGFTAEQLERMIKTDPGAKRLFELSDYIIEGRFELAKRTLELRFRGSSNQRIIDVKKSLEGKKTVFCEL